VRGHNYQTLANIGLTVALVGLGTGLGLYLMDDETPPAQAGDTRVGVGLGSLQLSGVF
jgi:hypothetical protein